MYAYHSNAPSVRVPRVEKTKATCTPVHTPAHTPTYLEISEISNLVKTLTCTAPFPPRHLLHFFH